MVKSTPVADGNLPDASRLSTWGRRGAVNTRRGIQKGTRVPNTLVNECLYCMDVTACFI